MQHVQAPSLKGLNGWRLLGVNSESLALVAVGYRRPLTQRPIVGHLTAHQGLRRPSP